MNNYDKLRITFSSDGVFRGYLKSISRAKRKIVSTSSKELAKTYAKRETALKDAELANEITNGTFYIEIV